MYRDQAKIITNKFIITFTPLVIIHPLHFRAKLLT